MPQNVSQVDVNVDVLETSALLSFLRRTYSKEFPDTTLSWSISYERKIPYLIFTYIPIYEGLKVNRFKYSVNLTYQEFMTCLRIMLLTLFFLVAIGIK